MSKNLEQQKKDNLQPRPPVVVVLGHVDSGKTSILDFIKKTKVVEKESGGITQHIGAYEIEHNEQKITFIDTPGHEAFSTMRSRGAKVADIAVLVIDSAEGVKAQTKEAISYIKKAQIPIIVALNKMDLPQANPEQAKRELEKIGIQAESLGGKVPCVEVSAKTGHNIKDILEVILLIAEMEELKTRGEEKAKGVIIEAYLNSKRGPTATLLVREGSFKKGDIIGAFSTYGIVRVLEDFQGKCLNKAVPSQPVVVVGFEKVPRVGEKFQVYSTIEEAKKGLGELKEKRTREVIFVEKGKKVLNLILKVDVLGSLEAVEGVLKNLPQEKVIVRILEKKVGEINEKDIRLAKSGKAKIFAFRIKPDAIAKRLAERENVKIISFDVIYDLVQAVRTLMEKLLEPEIVRQDLGELKVLVIFKQDKKRQVIGCKVLKGEVIKGVIIEIWRGDDKIGQGKVVNLQKNKKETGRGSRGDEVGILYEGEGLIEQDDILVAYKENKKKGEL